MTSGQPIISLAAFDAPGNIMVPGGAPEWSGSSRSFLLSFINKLRFTRHGFEEPRNLAMKGSVTCSDQSEVKDGLPKSLSRNREREICGESITI